jgi:hypothetical protein
MARVTDRRWIALDHHGCAILGRALSEIPWSDAPNEAEILAAVACLQCQDPPGEPGEMPAWVAKHGIAAGVADEPVSASPSPIRAIHKETVVSMKPKDFHWTEGHFKRFPALWAHCAVGLPSSADWIDQETPIAKRQEQDDVVKCMAPIFAELASELLHRPISIWVRPVRDGHVYERLLYLRETEKPVSQAGRPCLKDGTVIAAELAFQYMRDRLKAGAEITIAAAARWVMAGHVGWVDKRNAPNPCDHLVVVDTDREDGDGARLAAMKVARRMREIDGAFLRLERERISTENQAKKLAAG